ncbi:signal recognition particle-docking protein FtsY [Candidatus Woesearchaeota archaeon]|nr:signal recognition particle-docking protein FtsY [Candidatus Woesearchaeota archaeon]
MFKFLKDKLKGAISKLSRKAEEEAVQETEESAEEKSGEIKKLEAEKKKLEQEEKKVEAELKKEKEKARKAAEKKKEEKKPEPKKEEKKPEPRKEKAPEKPKAEEKKPEPKPKEKIEKLERKKEEIRKEEKEIEKEEKAAETEKKGLFSKLAEKITKTRLSEENFEKLFWDLEVVLLENGVAVEVIDKIKNDLKKTLVENPIPRGKIESTILKTLKDSIKEVLSVESIDLTGLIRQKKEKPYVICFVGVNGSGKTTSIAKVVRKLQDSGLSCVIAAADTFRAAAIDQLQLHADRLKVKMIKHDYGADAAAVAFDAIKHAKAKGIDAVLVDTAGRMHSNANLMDEMKKIVRVAKPDMKVFVGESIVGNDCIEQAKQFNDAVGIDAIILSKADVDEKGGAAISISYVTKKPIIFIGTGQEYKDLKNFEPEIVLESLGL